MNLFVHNSESVYGFKDYQSNNESVKGGSIERKLDEGIW